MDMKTTLENSIRETLHPMHLEVSDESHMHSVPEGAQTHFKVVVVSEAFEGASLVNRHRRVNSLLGEAFSGSLHALALHTMTPDEWFKKGGLSPDSPECLGGSKQA
jgi:BolA protein